MPIFGTIDTMRIAIAGYGVEGWSNYEYFRRVAPDSDVVIVDERTQLDGVPEGAQTLLGAGVFGQLDDFELVVRTAGLAPRKIATDGRVWSATNEFFAKCPATIIGVTGTKGKGTTCSLIASILRAAGKTVHLVGNIGVPALDILHDIQPDDIVVYELSSFQLWDLEKSPQVAVVLMIEPDHLEVHRDFEEYVAAKANITRQQTATDTVIYHPTNEFAEAIAAMSQGRKQRYDAAEDEAVCVKNDMFFTGEHAICGVDTLHIAGVHNRENACAAISAARVVAPEVTDGQVAEGLAAFHGLPHRLQFVREVGGVTYYDDSIATTPGSAIAALQSFDRPKIIILGGYDKGANYTEVVEQAKEVDARVIAIGQTGRTVYELCRERGVRVELLEHVDMRTIVEKAHEQARSGDIVILSPASASFDMFKNAKDRGEQFVAAVEALS